MKSVLVPTDVAVAFIMREGVTAEAARKWIYRACSDDVLINYGRPGKGNARWDLAEIEAAMWPKSPLHKRHLPV